jgi:hypothetical protein
MASPQRKGDGKKLKHHCKPSVFVLMARSGLLSLDVLLELSALTYLQVRHSVCWTIFHCKFSLQIFTAMSLQVHCIVAASSLQHCCNVTAMLLQVHYNIAAISLQCRCKLLMIHWKCFAATYSKL